MKSRLAALAQALNGRITFNAELPEEVQTQSQSRLNEGVLAGDRVWYSFGAESGERFCFSHQVEQVSAAEISLIRMILAPDCNEVAGRALWQEMIFQTLHESVEPFTGAVRIEDERESIAVPWSWPVFLVGLRLSDRQSQEQTGEVKKTFDSLAEQSEIMPYIMIDETLIVGIFPIAGQDKEAEEASGQETAQALVDGLMSESFLDARAVWSGALHSFPELLRTLKRMLFVAHTAEGLTPERNVLSVQGLGVYELLFATKTPFRVAYADHILPAGALLLLGSELEQTVMMFVHCDLNMSETARQLYLHRNSLLYRIERIRELTGYDIRHFTDAVTIWAALLLKRL